MIEEDKQLLPILEVMHHFAQILVLETEMLTSGNLSGMGQIIADKSMYVHKYSNMAQGFLASNIISSLSNEAKNTLMAETATLLKLIEENEKALANQQESYGIVIKLFQTSVNQEIKPVTYDKTGIEAKKHQNPPLALNEQV